jgi:hypothetical protein
VTIRVEGEKRVWAVNHYGALISTSKLTQIKYKATGRSRPTNMNYDAA